MRHKKQGRKMGREKAPRKALWRNLGVQFFTHGKIETTEIKAKELRSFVEPLITTAKKQNLAARRALIAALQDEKIADKVLKEIAPKYKDRDGGYTRVVKMSSRRLGDGARTAIIELV